MPRAPLKDGGPRWDEIVRPTRGAQTMSRRRLRLLRGLFYTGLFLSLTALLATGVYAYVALRLKTNSQEIPELSSPVPDQPVNVLLIGSDTRAGLPPEEQAKLDPGGARAGSGQRADTIIMLHLDEAREKAVLIHFPRDLRVTYPNGAVGKINGAYNQGAGPMVDTVEAFTGLPVHHYIEVDFLGFKRLTETIGGVRVHFERAILEPDSGLDVPAGCVELEGDQALAFVRVRKIDSDFGRIERQQMFLRLVMERVTSAGTLLNPVKLVKLVNVFADNVTTNTSLSVSEMRKMAWRLRTFNPSKVDMRIVPSSGASIGGVSYVVHDPAQAPALFEAMRERGPLPDYGRTAVSTIDPNEIRITVLNGTNVEGLAAKAAEELQSKGYEVQQVGNARDRGYQQTVVLYKEGNEAKGNKVAAEYGAAVQTIASDLFPNSEVVIVLGTDFAEGAAVAEPPPPAAPSRSAPLFRPCDA